MNELEKKSLQELKSMYFDGLRNKEILENNLRAILQAIQVKENEQAEPKK